MIERLKSCPNCAGLLNDFGTCVYCGSKVYDFMNIDFSDRYKPSKKTYIRIKVDDEVVIAPVVVDRAAITRKADNCFPLVSDDDIRLFELYKPTTEITLDLRVVGDMYHIDRQAYEREV